jgi:ATP-dependent RNA helicase RhlE
MKFSDLRLSEPILRAVSAEGYTVATPIQTQAIPHVLEGKDVMGCAQTGTGKTAAFALPILQRLTAKTGGNGAPPRGPRCLVLCPTRELALQIADSFRTYGKNLHLRHTVIFGGVNQHHQVIALRRGVDIVIATPGRLLDLMNQGHVDLRNIEVLVLDEADRMLDMGFIHDIKRIIAKVPSQRQTLMFSATMPAEIRQLANSLLRHPVTVQVTPAATPIEAIDQSVYFVDKKNKPTLLAHLYNELPIARAIVFTRTKHGADRVVRHLHARGIRAEAIHGNKSQNARERALANFRASKTPILVATDIASRGIDVDGITHVVNYDLTHEPETYVHRIGRTARAGASGAAVSFCDRDERQNLKAIESLIRRTIPVRNNHPVYPAGDAPASNERREDRRPQGPTHAHHPRSAHQTHQTHQPSRTGGGGNRRSHAPQATLAGLSGQSTATATSVRPNKPHARHPLHGGVSKHRRGAGVARGGNRRPF